MIATSAKYCALKNECEATELEAVEFMIPLKNFNLTLRVYGGISVIRAIHVCCKNQEGRANVRAYFSRELYFAIHHDGAHISGTSLRKKCADVRR